jgi:hypothetical protein
VPDPGEIDMPVSGPAPGFDDAPTATTASAMTSAPAPPTRAALVITGETWGWLEPCGCAEGMLGGVAKRVALVRAIARRGLLEPVFLDGGDLSREPGPQTDLKLDALERAYRLLPLGAVALGTRDIPHRERLDRAFGERLLVPGGAPRALETRAGTVRVGVALGPTARVHFEAAGLPAPEGIPDAADILLFEATIDEAEAALARAAAAPALAVATMGDEAPAPEKRLAKGTLLVAVTQKAKHALVVALDREGGALRATLERPPVPLGERIPDDPEAAAIVLEYKDMLMAANLLEEEEKRPLVTGGAFVGPETCGACHAPQYAVYQKMKHAHSFESLRPRKGTHDPECLRCHVTGAGFATGFTSEERTPDLAHVSCESCHGVGGNHVQAMMSGLAAARREGRAEGAGEFGRIREPRKLCVECHDKENSPKFDYDVYWPKIKHGREGLPPR